MVSLFPPLPPRRNFPLRINIKYFQQQDKNLEIAKGLMRRSRIPLLFINSQLTLEDKYLKLIRMEKKFRMKLIAMKTKSKKREKDISK
jgi:CO dehydrogenase/acetyl-CoA synthase epsilon subunit